MFKKFPRLIGVIHLEPLAGAPRAHGEAPQERLQAAGARAIEEAKLLSRLGFDALILENFGDAPFFKTNNPPETVASLAIIAAAVKEAVAIPVGLNVLRNDALSALAIAAVTGCEFIRVNVLSGVYATDQGFIEGCAAELLRQRERLHAPVAIFADALVKHALPLSTGSLENAIADLANRGGADAIILTGESTGMAPSMTHLERGSKAAKAAHIPLYLGSGFTSDRASDLLPHCTGVIVGSALRKGARAGQPLDPKRAGSLARAVRKSLRK